MFLLSAPPQTLACREPVDIRNSFDGAIAAVKGVLGEGPLSNSLFVFFIRRGNHLTLIKWDRTGYRLLPKRVKQCLFHLTSDDVTQVLSVEGLRLILAEIALGKRRTMR